MWVVAAALVITYSLARAAAAKPDRKNSWETDRLLHLATKKKLTLDEAEDGVVLSRRYSSPGLERKFRLVVASLKKRTKSS